MNGRRIVSLAWKEWREIVRDRLFFALAFFVPTLLMVLFGFGLTLDVENLPFAVVDQDRSAASRDYAYRFVSSRYFDFKGQVEDVRQLDRLLERERLGSTGIGGGIAIPHSRLASLEKPVGMFARLAHPVDFDSIDERPVDIVFLLAAPEGAGADHLKALARVSRLLRDRSLVEKLRATESAEALYALLVESVQAQSAA